MQRLTPDAQKLAAAAGVSGGLHHESVNGWGTGQTAGRLKQLCREWCAYLKRVEPGWNLRPEDIPVRVDADGLGSGVVDQAAGFCFIPVSALSVAYRSNDYPNIRSELWFNAAELARGGRLSVAGLPVEVRQALKQQALAVTWKVDAQGRCQVEKKEEVKKRLGRSPDDMDAVNLSYLAYTGLPAPIVVDVPPPSQPAARGQRDLSAEAEARRAATRRKIYGR